MGKLLNIIERELDPRHDFDRVGYLFPSHYSQNIKDRFRHDLYDLYFMVNSVKHIARGFAGGAGIGALGFYLAGDDPKTGALTFGAMGSSIDFAQYVARGALISTVKGACKFTRQGYLYLMGCLRQH